MNGEVLTRGAVSFALQLNTLADMREFCGVLAKTDMVPKAYINKPDNILVAVLHGQELGLPYLQALQSIAVVNGIPSIYGDAALAMVRASGKMADFDEFFEVDGERVEGSSFPLQQYVEAGKLVTAVCVSQRVGASRPRRTTYAVNDAKRAGLWAKEGTWQTVPQRMLMWRARGWNLRDNFGDVLKGLAIYEEAMDIETSRNGDGSYRVVNPDSEKLKAQLEDGREKLKRQQETPEVEPAKLAEPVKEQPGEPEQPASSQAEKAEPSMPESTASALYAQYAKRIRSADTISALATIMNEALNGPESLNSQDERRSIQLLKDTCLAKLRKKK